jgi:hypothetical protein
MQLRLLEIARAKAADQAEQMLDELECSRCVLTNYTVCGL